MSKAIIRGDLAPVSLGQHTIICTNAVIRPPFKRLKGGTAFVPLVIGDHVIVEENAIVNASLVGSHVHIGKGAVIGARTIIRPCAVIEAGSYVPPDSIIAPFTIWKGHPAKPASLWNQERSVEEEYSAVGEYSTQFDISITQNVLELPECWMEIQQELTTTFYEHFVATE